jgi:hypothetical protein
VDSISERCRLQLNGYETELFNCSRRADTSIADERDWLASELRIDVIKRILQDGRDPMVIFSRDEDLSIELGDLRSKTPRDCVLRRYICWRGWFVEERQWIIPQVDNLEYSPAAGCREI